MLKSKLLVGASVAALCAPFAATSQEFSYGFGLEAGDVSLSSGGPAASYDYQAVVIEGRVTHNFTDEFYVGGQLSFGEPIDGSAVNGIRRASLIGGYSLGQVDLFASVGYGQLNVDLLSGFVEETYQGATYSFGLDYAYSDAGKIRVEVINDQFKNEGGIKTSADNTALRIGAAFEF